MEVLSFACKHGQTVSMLGLAAAEAWPEIPVGATDSLFQRDLEDGLCRRVHVGNAERAVEKRESVGHALESLIDAQPGDGIGLDGGHNFPV